MVRLVALVSRSMAKGGWRPRTCRVCGRGAKDGVYVSQRGLCRDDALRRETENMDSLVAHTGAPFDYWRLRTTASYGAIPLELIPQYLDAHPELT